MKKLLLLFTLIPCIAFGQTTYVPDDNLEAYLEGLGGFSNGANDDSVLTSGFGNLDTLVLDENGACGHVSRFTGLEDAVNLTLLQVANMELFPSLPNVNVFDGLTASTLQLVGCTGLLYFMNNLTTNIILDSCSFDQLQVMTNPLLSKIDFQNSNNTIGGVGGGYAVYIQSNNSLQSLDFSNVTLLGGIHLQVANNASLTQLNLKNGQCILWGPVAFQQNPYLYCIQVDDPSYSEGGWYWLEKQTEPNTRSYSTDCGYPLSIQEPPTKDKHLLYITDILGRTTHPTPNTLLFYIYDDGSVEKRIQLER